LVEVLGKEPEKDVVSLDFLQQHHVQWIVITSEFGFEGVEVDELRKSLGEIDNELRGP
jgi:hypothetical protein